MTTTPTQVRRPWRATARTAFAVIVGLAAMLPLLVEAAGIDQTLPPVAGALAIAGAITRIMALPQVETFLARFLPFLAADPSVRTTRRTVPLSRDERGQTSTGVLFAVILAAVVAAWIVIRVLQLLIQ